MRIRISHETRYRYDAPISGVIQTLRLTPRNHEGHYVIHWRIDVTEDCRLDEHEDAFGNITHTFTAEGPFNELAVAVEGEVDVQDTGGVVRGGIGNRTDGAPRNGFGRTAGDRVMSSSLAPIAQSAERLHGKEKVYGSIPYWGSDVRVAWL